VFAEPQNGVPNDDAERDRQQLGTTGNVRPLAETLSLWVGYDFDDSDGSAISHGLEGTDADAGRSFSYPIAGSPELTLVLGASSRRGPSIGPC